MHELTWLPQKTREIITFLLVLSHLLLRARKGGGEAIGPVVLRLTGHRACFHVTRHGEAVRTTRSHDDAASRCAKKRRFRMHGQSKNDSFLLEFIGLCVAWTKSEPAIFFSFSVDFGCEDFLRRRTPLSLGVIVSTSIGRDNANGRDHAKLSRFAGDGVSPSHVMD